MPEVRALTFFFKGVVTAFFPEPLGPDDLTVRELAVKTANEILVRLEEKKNKLDHDDAEVIGFAARRLYFVLQAYSLEKKKYTLPEWIERLRQVTGNVGSN